MIGLKSSKARIGGGLGWSEVTALWKVAPMKAILDMYGWGKVKMFVWLGVAREDSLCLLAPTARSKGR